MRFLSRYQEERLAVDCSDENVGGITADDGVDYSDLETVKLQKAILSLPTEQQPAFNLRYYDELEYDKIAEITDSTAANVKANYHIAKDKIVQYMNSHD